MRPGDATIRKWPAGPTRTLVALLAFSSVFHIAKGLYFLDVQQPTQGISAGRTRVARVYLA